MLFGLRLCLKASHARREIGGSIKEVRVGCFVLPPHVVGERIKARDTVQRLIRYSSLVLWMRLRSK